MKKRLLSFFVLLALLLTLTACAAGACEVRFELSGGELVSGELLQTVPKGGAAEPPEVRRDGYVFDGWSADCSEVRSNMVIAARWTRESEPSPEPRVYEVRFEMNGGELVSGRLLQQVEEGGAAEPPELKREGYAFDGWNEKLDPIESNVIAAAMWKRLYKVSFDAAGGEILRGEAEQLVPEGEYPDPPELSRRNYAFSGWNAEVEPAKEDAVYTAAWSAVELRSEEVFSKIAPAVVEIHAEEASGYYYSLGSGFFIDDRGTLVTNYHVIDGTVSGQIALSDGRSCDIIAVLGCDPLLDLAILRADVSGNAWLTLSEKGVVTGETIYAMGSSEGLTSSFSSGNVSAASRVIDDVRYIQITAPVSQGNSGGPLVNSFGEVVGINTMGYAEGQNLNFAVDIRELEKIDRSLELSLAELYALQYPNGAGGETDGDDSVYSLADYAEEESNDTFLRADRIENGKLIAGELPDPSDVDWFFFTLDKAGDVEIYLAPFYAEDIDYLLCGIVRINEEGETELFDVLQQENDGEITLLHGTVHLDQPGDYFLVLLLDEAYPFEESAGYLLGMDW